MWKLVTGEPYAGKSHVRFGGRGGAEPSLPLSSDACVPREFGEAAVVVGLVDDLLGGLEVVGDGWLVLVLVGAGSQEFGHGEVVVAEVELHFAAVGDFEYFL